MIRYVRFGGVLWLAILALIAVPMRAHTVLRDLEYARVDGVPLLLDLYLPEDSANSRVPPVVLWVHGGGWRNGSKDETYAPSTLGEAYAVASINYRLSGISTFPAQIHDVKAAVRWLRAHAELYGFDPERFGAWGSSAGGHLVALLGVSCGQPDLEGTVGEHLDQSSCVQAVCDFYGPTDFLTLVEHRGLGNERRTMAEDLLLGGRVEDLSELAALASPSTHIHAEAPPFLILHGSDDPIVPVEQSVTFYEALLEAGVTASLITIDGAGHGFSRTHLAHVKPFFDEWLQRSEAVSSSGTVSALHRHGQTFVTWTEAEQSHFAVYRSEIPIHSVESLPLTDRLAIVPVGSSRNLRASEVEREDIFYVIEPGAPALNPSTGLLVHTAIEDADAYYAVAACTATGGLIDWIGAVGPISERVDVPEPVRQSEQAIREHVRARFVHWAPHVDTDEAQALSNRPHLTFDFVVWEPRIPDNGGPALFALHGGGGTYANAVPVSTHPGMIVVSPESIIPGRPADVDRSWDAWYGYNTNVGLGAPLADGVNVDYTTRRLRWMAEWLVTAYPSVDSDRIFLRGSSMGGVGTVFSSIMLRDTFAAGIAIVPRFDYGADDVFLESFATFDTRWGSIDDNVISSDGMGVFDRLDAGYLAQNYTEWDFAPVWAFNGRHDTAVGWSEKIPFYRIMNDTKHGWAFYWDLRAHGGRSSYPRVWRESGWEDAVFSWMVENIRLDQSYPAFSNCTINDNPGSGDVLDGDAVGTINGYLQWDSESISDESHHWSIELALHPDAPEDTCRVDVTPRRLQSFELVPDQSIFYRVNSLEGEQLAFGSIAEDANKRYTAPQIPVTKQGIRLVLSMTP